MSHLDVICIPTTCGTGSEVTSKAVLSRPELHEKGSISHDIWPKYAFVDETYLTSASDSLIVSTAVDALAHLIESHLNKNKNSFSLMCTTYGLSLFKEMKEELIHKEFNYKKLMMTSSIASIYQKMEETGVKEGILFIDEINCVSETLAPTMLQFLQGKTFGNQAIPEGWIIAGAGNPMEYNKSVREFDMVTLDRVRYLNVEQDFEKDE